MLRRMESFVVRVWVTGEDEGAGDDDYLRGVVEHVATGEADPFRSAEELAAILRGRTRPEGNTAGPDLGLGRRRLRPGPGDAP